MVFTKKTASAAGKSKKEKKVSNATVVLREREARRAAKETELAREKAASAAATAEEEEELRQAKVRQREREAKLRQLEECVASQRKTGARRSACARSAYVAGKSAEHSASVADEDARREAKDVECREETPLRKDMSKILISLYS